MWKPGLILVAEGFWLASMAATSSIGVVHSAGDFQVDGSVVRGNGTLFEGNVVETATARSVIQLGDAQVTLSPGSRAKVYHDHTILERGTGILRGTHDHLFEADSLQVFPGARDSVVQVGVDGPSRVSVFSVSGNAQVRNSSGLLLASLNPGMALDFDEPPQAGGGTTAVKLVGIVSKQNGKYFLTDSTTHVTVEIQGANLAKLVDKNVMVTGSVVQGATAATGASEVVAVSSVQILGGAGAAAAATGIAVGAKVAIIAGIAVAGAAGGLAAAGTFSSSATSSSAQ